MAKDVEALTGADATDFGAVIRSYVNTSESITSGASPVAADPDIATTVWTTGGTKGTETVTLADPSVTTRPFIKTFEVKFAGTGDVPTLSIATAIGFTNPLIIQINHADPYSAVVQLCWNPALDGGTWQALVGGALFTNGNDIKTSGGQLDTGGGGVNAGGFSTNGHSGVSVGPFTTITSITVENGLVTALAGS